MARMMRAFLPQAWVKAAIEVPAAIEQLVTDELTRARTTRITDAEIARLFS